MSYVDDEWDDFRWYDFDMKDRPFCKVKFTRTKRQCLRRQDHRGVHAYPGSKFVVTWNQTAAGGVCLRRESVENKD